MFKIRIFKNNKLSKNKLQTFATYLPQLIVINMTYKYEEDKPIGKANLSNLSTEFRMKGCDKIGFIQSFILSFESPTIVNTSVIYKIY